MADQDKDRTPVPYLAASALLALVGFFFPLGGLLGLAGGFLALMGLKAADSSDKRLKMAAWVLLAANALVLILGTLQALTGLAQIQ